MVKIVDKKGRGYNVSVWGSIIPAPGRSPVSRIGSRQVSGIVPPSVQTEEPVEAATAGSAVSANKTEPKKEDQSFKIQKKIEKKNAVKHAAKAVLKTAGKNESSTENPNVKGKVEAPEPAQPKPETVTHPMPSSIGPRPSKELGDWTPQHDIQLLELKDVDSRKWIDVVILMGRHKKALVQRYEELKRAQEEATTSKPISSAPELRTVLDTDDDNWSATDPTDAIDFDPAELQPVLEVAGTELSLRETRMAVHLNDYLEDQKWLFLASKIFDKTGKRFTPQQLREGLGGDLDI